MQRVPSTKILFLQILGKFTEQQTCLALETKKTSTATAGLHAQCHNTVYTADHEYLIFRFGKLCCSLTFVADDLWLHLYGQTSSDFQWFSPVMKIIQSMVHTYM